LQHGADIVALQRLQCSQQMTPLKSSSQLSCVTNKGKNCLSAITGS